LHTERFPIKFYYFHSSLGEKEVGSTKMHKMMLYCAMACYIKIGQDRKEQELNTLDDNSVRCSGKNN
jgi:hypothetical protein